MEPGASFKPPKPSAFSQKQNETIVVKPGTLSGSEVSLKDLINCEVFILDHSSVVLVENCSNSRIRIGPVAGFCHIRTCVDCVFSVAARDVELSRCSSATLYLYCANDPHIENSFDLLIAPYNFAYPMQDQHFRKAGLAAKENAWDKVTDHTALEHASNWDFLPLEDCEEVKFDVESLGKAVNPVAKPPAGNESHLLMGARKNDMFHQQSPKVGSNAGDPLPDDFPNPTHLTDISLNQHDTVSGIGLETRNILTEVEPTEAVQIFYTRDEEFIHEFALPHVGVSISMLVTSLQKASRVAARFYDDLDFVMIGGFTVLAVALLLALIVVLLHIFTELYGGGLAVELCLITVAFVTLEVMLALRHRRIVSQGNLEMSKLLEHETKTLYSSRGVELRGDLALLEVVVCSTQ